MVIFEIFWPISLASVLQCYKYRLKYQSSHIRVNTCSVKWDHIFDKCNLLNPPTHILSIICDVQHRLYFDKLHPMPFCCWLKWNWEYKALPSIAILRRAGRAIWRIGRQTASTENILFSRKLSMHKAKAQARHILTSCLRTLRFFPLHKIQVLGF